MTDLNKQQVEEIVEAVSDRMDKKIDERINYAFAERQRRGVEAASSSVEFPEGVDEDEFLKSVIKEHLDKQGKVMDDEKKSVRDKTGWEKTKSGLGKSVPYLLTALGTIVVAESGRWGVNKIKDKRAAKQAAMEF